MSSNPFTLEKQPDGKVHIKYETGEEFTGDPLEVTQKIAEAHVNTKKWAQGIRAENDTLKSAPPTTKNDPPPNTPPTDPNESQLQNYLVEQWAKGLGFKDGAEAKAQLGRMTSVTSEVEDNIVATQFLAQCPDFPNTPEAIDALSKKIDQLGGQFRPIDMVAAHSLCVREGTYKALTAEEINNQWANNMSNASRTANTPPPPPPPGQAGANQGAPQNEYEMPLDDLRKQILERNAKGERAIGGSLESV